MLKLSAALASLILCSNFALGKALSRAEYQKKFGTTAGDKNDDKAIEACLKSWGSHPFTEKKDRQYRVMDTKVKVVGIGSDPADDSETSYPQLVLIKPTVNVMGKLTYRLLNPNGWYCFKSNVTVLAKSVIKAHCKAHIADARSGATVLGSGPDSGKGGVTVLGKTKIEQSCGA